MEAGAFVDGGRAGAAGQEPQAQVNRTCLVQGFFTGGHRPICVSFCQLDGASTQYIRHVITRLL